MKIAIMGAGRMGSLVAGNACRGGAECFLVDPWKEHVDAINTNGLTIQNNNDEPYTVSCKAVTSADQIDEKVDLIVILVMGKHTREAVEASMCLADEHTYCLTLQNGLGNVEVIEEYYPKERILYGIMPYGGTVLGPGKVHTLCSSRAQSHFGSDAFEDPNDFMLEFAKIMCSQGLLFNADKKSVVDAEIWYKLARNASGNAICAVCHLPLGPASHAPGYTALETALFYEVAAVAAAQGIVLAKFNAGAKFSPTSPMFYHLPSTAQDVQGKKKTEVEFINGAVARLGDKLGIPTPYNHMVADFLRIIDSTYEYQF